MADAKRCDRCEGYFMSREYSSELERVQLINYRGNMIKGYDLCPDCCKQFIYWLKNKITEA